ncbi:CaiB/BaiF CoA-transferase family protein [Frigidibacter sp. MR17.14]|uniref:CaiB/BaiF CoA transferase family protein n=1 Tax=Frigidibacter sp. MR17.14 TaxID=3126509 RepID=UPI0030130831
MSESLPRTGPLAGLKVIEMAGIGPCPFAAMVLADLGAEVLRIDRAAPPGLGIERPEAFDYVLRGRSAVALDLKTPEAVAAVLDLVAGADALIEGFRPGVMERLGLGPAPCLARNPALVYGRVTGWGQDGPMAPRAGHDLGYLALSGILSMIGPEGGAPVPPLNLLADYAGGSLMLVIGLLSALTAARAGAGGQVVDAAMLDGLALLGTPMAGLRAAGLHDGPRGTNLLDGGLPEYACYPCRDGGWLAVAALEPKFRDLALAGFGLVPADWPIDRSPTGRARLRAALGAAIATRDRDDWARLFAGTDACVTPVLSPEEAPHHPQLAARATHAPVAGHLQPAPAPRFSATPPAPPAPFRREGPEALARWGLDPDRIERLAGTGALVFPEPV